MSKKLYNSTLVATARTLRAKAKVDEDFARAIAAAGAAVNNSARSITYRAGLALHDYNMAKHSREQNNNGWDLTIFGIDVLKKMGFGKPPKLAETPVLTGEIPPVAKAV